MRHFEFRDDKSAKFWSIDLQGIRFTVRFGKVGTTGQTQTKEFANESQARDAHDKLVAEKVKKGYVECGGASVRGPAAAPAAPRKATQRAKAPSPPPPPPVAPGPGTTGSATLDALLAAVRAEPDDDPTRLVLADWLDEHGDSARAEFIRVQCDLSRRGVVVRPQGVFMPGPFPAHHLSLIKPDAEVRALLDRERKLLAKHRAEWLTGLPSDERAGSDRPFRYDFKRGLLRLEVNLGQGRGGGRVTLQPHLIQQAMNCLAALNALAEQPAFAWVAQVEVDASGDSFGNTVDGGEDYAALFTHPALRHVTSLRLDWMFGGDTVDFTPLSTRRDLDRFTDLSVDASNVEDSAPIDADALWASPAVANLRRLKFCGPADFLPLAQSTHLTRLQSLDTGFYHDLVGDQGLATLADSSHFPELQHLSLRNSEGGHGYHPLSVLRLLLSPRLPGLEWVDFDFSDVLDDAVWENWATTFQHDLPEDAAGLVRTLTAIGDAGAHGDRVRRVCCGIELLLYSPNLNWNQDQPKGKQAPLPSDLSNTRLGDVVLTALAASPQLARLVNPNPDGDRSKKAKSSRKKSAPGLTELNLSNNTFGDAGALALADSPHASGLQRLNVSGNRLSESALTRLRGRFPEVLFSPPPAW
jgi:uncharacterized protein (TIGR02996 family)